MATLLDELVEELHQHADPVRAAQERAYLKHDREHLGVSVPAIRAVAKGFLRRHDLAHDELADLVEGLWRSPLHECRMATAEILAMTVDRLGPADVPMLERFLRTARTWALVDGLAPHVVGPLVVAHPDLTTVLDRWATDDDFWLRRSALLALLVPLRKGGGDLDRFLRYADAMLDEKEFFVRKAIGWVLRDVGKKRPDVVFAWLLPRARRASGVTLREAVKALGPEQRQAIELARRA